MADPTEDLARRLLARRPDLQLLLDDTRPVEDILAGPRTIKACDKSDSSKKPQSRYLPRNLSEHPDEYQKRLDITPCFFETPNVLQARQGALFREPPRVDLPETFAWFEGSATGAGQTLLDVIVKASELAQTNGFAGVLLDREVLPADVEARPISMAEVAERQLGRPLWAIYAASQILDFGEDAKGLAWLRLVEERIEKPRWDADAVTVQTVRCVDRQQITVYEIRNIANGKRDVIGPTTVNHGARDERKEPVVPFVFLHPFPGRDGLGRSVMRGVAEADLAATRVLSDLLWILHMTVPLLTLKTDRSEEEIGNIGLGASRFLVLKNKSAGNEAEELEFTQVDIRPAEALAKMYSDLVGRAKDQASKTEAVGISGPVQESGISKAWTFKTGEERVLHLLSQSLSRSFNRLLDLTARFASVDPELCTIAFPESFDVQGPEYALKQGVELLPVFAEYGLNSAVMATLEKVFTAWISNPTQEQWDKFKEELEALAERNLRPEAVLAASANQPQE